MKTYTGPSGSIWYSTDGRHWYASPEAAALAQLEEAQRIAEAGARTETARRIAADPFAAAFDGI
jgi:streptogramin lyase